MHITLLVFYYVVLFSTVYVYINISIYGFFFFHLSWISHLKKIIKTSCNFVGKHWYAAGELFPIPSPSFLVLGEGKHLKWLLLRIKNLFWKVGKNVIRVKTFILNLLFRKSSWEARLQRRSIFYFKKDFGIWDWN